jgi:hypothetical protein
MKMRTSYDVLPLSFRLIVMTTDLTIKESLNVLTTNGELIPLALAFVDEGSDCICAVVGLESIGVCGIDNCE